MLLSDQGANFESNIVKELCEFIGIWKVRISPYHTQTNGKVEWGNQMLMCMTGKLSRDRKVDWPKHLSELVRAYNSMRLAITGHTYSTLCLGSNHAYLSTFTSLWWGTQRNVGMSNTTLLSYMNGCEMPWRKHKCSLHLRLRDRSNTLTGGIIPFNWRQVTWSWLKMTPTGGRGKWRTSGRRNCMKWNTKLLKESICTLWKTSRQDAHESSTETDFSHCFCRGDSPLYSCAS